MTDKTGKTENADDATDQATQPVCIVGGTGALGFGLALRLGQAGIPIVIGSRDEQRAHEAAERASGAVPGSECAGRHNAEAGEGARSVIRLRS